MKFDSWYLTDKGLRRDSNQDSCLVNKDLGLFIVADGMGGHEAGELASAATVGAIVSATASSSEADEALREQGVLPLESDLMRGHGFSTDHAEYLFTNQRMLNTIHSSKLGTPYYILQIADFDVATIQPFDLRQSRPVFQNSRFSQIRFGSQVELIVPLSDRFDYEPLVPDTWHVEAGLDALVKLNPKPQTRMG